jgi:protein phosphatase
MYGARQPRLSIFARTHRGSRARNQDAFFVADLTAERIGLAPGVTSHTVGERGTLLAVSDGGGEGGETASELAVIAFHRLLSVLPLEVSPEVRLGRAAHHTAKYLYGHYRRHPEAICPVATLTAVLVAGESAHVAQIGDSRAYLLRDGRAERLTRDQTLRQALVDAGSIGYGHSDSNPPDLLIHSLGPDPTVGAVVTTVELRAGDSIVVCSDGLSDLVDDDELLATVRRAAHPEEACRHLVELALDRGAPDNVTVVVGRVESIDLDASQDETATWKLPNVFA